VHGDGTETGLANEGDIAPSTEARGETRRSGEDISSARISEAAKRALAEAHERRLKASLPLPPEVNGRDGLEPVRYGDWEVNGLASDF
jgi:hypothetical protein